MRATIAPSDFATQGADESDEHYRTPVALEPEIEVSYKPEWRTLSKQECDADPFYGSTVGKRCDATNVQLTGTVDQVGESESFDRPQRVYSVLWDNGQVVGYSMHKIVVMVTKRRSKGLDTRVPHAVYLAMKIGHKQHRERIEEWRSDKGLPILSKRAFQLTLYRNMRAAQHRHTRNQWSAKYGVDRTATNTNPCRIKSSPVSRE
jgi:hypothetical protein